MNTQWPILKCIFDFIQFIAQLNSKLPFTALTLILYLISLSSEVFNIQTNKYYMLCDDMNTAHHCL